MNTPRYRALIFDMDGTITTPVIDFQRFRQEIGFGPGDVAKEIEDLPKKERDAAWRVIERHERKAEAEQQLQEGTKELLERCRKDDIRIGLITRNVRRSVDRLCQKFDLVFDSIITREFPHIKPHPAPIIHMLTAWEIAAEDTLMIGDYIHDIHCGIAAGTATCFYMNPGCKDFGVHADFTVRSMAELGALLG